MYSERLILFNLAMLDTTAKPLPYSDTFPETCADRFVCIVAKIFNSLKACSFSPSSEDLVIANAFLFKSCPILSMAIKPPIVSSAGIMLPGFLFKNL